MPVPEEVTKLIGKTFEPMILEVEKGAIRRWADAIDDPNPLYRDLEYAKNSKYGGIVAPPGFTGWPVKGGLIEWMIDVMGPVMSAGYPILVDGGIEYEFYIPIRAGDTLTAHGKVADIYEKAGRTGKMIFVIIEINFSNQNNDKALIQRNIFICRSIG
jgi:acyl dehydratase